ncbi:MAG TPA: PaaI family thioesterase [Thermoanaerobaculia bacterium]|nr:PaaI family thioesterase [Thermoanaerobaculia bacterium]
MAEDRRPFLEMTRKMIAGELPQAPVGQLVGMRPTAVDAGRAVYELDATRRHANPMGTVHGGILCDLADAAMGVAWASGLADGETFTTLELKINFLKPVWETLLRAEATVVKRGKSVGLVACYVRDADGALVAHATSTCMTLRGDRAEGR